MIYYEDTQKGKITIVLTEHYKRFVKMSVFSKYMLIFQVWLCYVDYEKLYDRNSCVELECFFGIDDIFKELANTEINQWIVKSSSEHHKDFELQRFMDRCFCVAQTLSDLNLIDCILEKRNENHYIRKIVKQMKPTPLGRFIMQACSTRRYSWFNVFAEPLLEDSEVEIYEKEIDGVDSGKMLFLAPFISLFPDGTIDTLAINEIIYDEVNQKTTEDPML